MKSFIKFGIVLFFLAVVVSLYFYANTRKKSRSVDTDALYSQAATLLREHKPGEAIVLSKKILKATPKNTDARVLQGRAYMEMHNMPAAIAEFKAVLSANKKHPDALRYIANIEAERGNTTEALSYIDTYLQYYPKEKDMLLKKYYLLLRSGRIQESEEIFALLNQQFTGDEDMGAINYDYYLTKANEQRKRGRYNAASANYKKALSYKEQDTFSMQQIVNISVAQKNYRTAGTYNDKLLLLSPKSTTYLLNAATIAIAGGYPERGLEYAQRALQLSPGDQKVKQQYAEICVLLCKDAPPGEMANYAAMALEADPANRLAQAYLLNAHIAMHEYGTALQLAEEQLQQYPNDGELINKKIGILYASKQLDAATNYMEQVMKRYNTAFYRSQYSEIQHIRAKAAIDHQDYARAEAIVNKGLAVDPANRLLKEQLVSVYMMKGDFANAGKTLDELIARYPRNEDYLFKKSGMLEVQKRYEDAATISSALYNKHSGNELYRMAYVNQLLGMSKQAQEANVFDSANNINRRILEVDEDNYWGYVYQVNSFFAGKYNDSALHSVNNAMVYYSEDSLLAVKRATLLQANGYHREALLATNDLLRKYPHDGQLFQVYLEQMNLAGKYYQRTNDWDSSLQVFRNSYTYVPDDTFVLQNLAAIFFVKKQYDSVVYYADKGLKTHPRNEYLLLKKASAHEQMKQYRDASVAAGRLHKLSPGNKTYRDYADLMRMKGYQNQAGVTRLQSYFREAKRSTSITGLFYTRRFNGGSITGRLNYADRDVIKGAQAEVEAFIQHGRRFYSNALAGYSDTRAFPTTKLNYSLFADLGKSWEGELGARYMHFKYDSTNIVSGVASLGKSFGNAWINLRAYITWFNSDLYSSYLLTSHYYLNERRDYLYAIGGLGTTPDDPSLAFNYRQFAGFKTYTLGVGFQKNFRQGVSMNVSGTWYNRSLSEIGRQNQYDAYLMLSKSF